MISARREIVNFAIGESDQISEVTFMHNEDNFCNDSWYFLRVQSVLGIAYRNNINRIQLMNLEISITNLLRLLSYPDDFRTLQLFFINHSEDASEHVKIPPDPLPFFENIIIIDCGLSIMKMMTHLQPDSLKSVTVKVTTFDKLDLALKKQNAVVKLSLNCLEEVPLPKGLFAGHEFTHLILNVASIVNMSEFLTQFMSTLQFLDIGSTIDTNTYSVISKMENLNKLCVNLADVSGAATIMIAQLTNLSSLILYGGDSTHLEGLLSLKNFCLDFFDYPDCQPPEKPLVEMLKAKFCEEDAIVAFKGG